MHESGKSSTTFGVGVFWSGNCIITVDLAGKTQPKCGAFLECISELSTQLLRRATAEDATLTLVTIGFQHSSFVFASEANIHENKFNSYKMPASLLVLFLEKALTLIHMETHLTDDVSTKACFGSLTEYEACQSNY